jgi:hypothetical protein
LRESTLCDKVQGTEPVISMTAIEKYFFTPLYYPRSSWSVLRWWEARRPVFNLWVGGAGLVTLGVVSILFRLPPHPNPMSIPWQVVVVYGALANLCYTLGPIADVMLRRFLGERAHAVGPVLFRYGFVFSIGLTLLPVAVAGLGWLARLFFHFARF